MIEAFHGSYWSSDRSTLERRLILLIVSSALILVLSDDSKIYHFDLSVLNSEVVRLDIFVDKFCLWMELVNRIKHLQYKTHNAQRAFGIVNHYGMLFNALSDVLWLDNREIFVEVSLPEELWNIIIKTNNIRYFLVKIAFVIDGTYWIAVPNSSYLKS